MGIKLEGINQADLAQFYQILTEGKHEGGARAIAMHLARHAEAIIKREAEEKLAEIQKASVINEELLRAVQACYRKHHLEDPSIAWGELSDIMVDALSNAMGPREFFLWLKQQPNK